MKIAHFANWAPRQSGMYESVKDQIKYERREGAESIFIDAHHEDPEDRVDGWLKPSKWDDCRNADIWVLHSFIPEKVKDLFSKKINVAVLHGPTEHMMLKEWTSARQNQCFNLHINILWKYDATITLNKHEYDIMKSYDEYHRLYYIPNSIDIENYPAEGMTWEFLNTPAILSCDVPRLEKLPSTIIWAMPKIAERIPSARLNVFSLTLEPIGTWRNIFVRSHKRELQRLCENVQLENNNLKPFMRGADIGFNNNISGILSRVSMEMMALGTPIVSYGGDQNGIPYTDYVARVFDLDSIAEQIERCWKDLNDKKCGLKKKTIKFAQTYCSREKEVKKYMQLYNDLLKKKNG